MEVISAIFFVAFMLTIWFNTDAFPEYMELCGFGGFFHVDEYHNLIKAPEYTGIYIDFLKEYFDCFFVRLISCPICLATWLGILTSLILGIIYWPIISFLGLFAHRLLSKLL